MSGDPVPYIALGASLLFLATVVHYALQPFFRPAPPPRRPARPAPLPANSNEAPVPDCLPPAAAPRRLDLTALAVAIAGPGSFIAAAIGSGWLWSLQP